MAYRKHAVTVEISVVQARGEKFQIFKFHQEGRFN